MSTTTTYRSSPNHYARFDPQPIEAIEAWNLGFHLGNVVKYIVRAKHKDNELRNLRAAQWYLKRYIQVLEAGGRKPPKPDEQV